MGVKLKPQPAVAAPSLPRSLPVLPLRPMARALQVSLYEREVRVRLSGPAIEILLGRARVIAEGKRSDSPSAGEAFFGSIMLTIDLRVLDGDVREACDPSTATRVAEMMAADARVLKRVRAIAEREAARLAGGPVRAHSADVRLRAEGPLIYVDVDVEGPPAPGS
jgi:hypothetical protein